MGLPFWVNSRSIQELLNKSWGSSLTASQMRHPWQQVLVDGTPVPGLCHLRRVKRKLSIQKNKSSGNDGSSVTIKGLLNPEFSLDVEIYTPDQFNRFLGFLDYVDITGKPSLRERHTLDHPMARMAKVGACVFLSSEFDAPEMGGPLRCKLELVGYGSLKKGTAVQPPVAPPTPSTTNANTQRATQATPVVQVPTVGR